MENVFNTITPEHKSEILVNKNKNKNNFYGFIFLKYFYIFLFKRVAFNIIMAHFYSYRILKLRYLYKRCQKFFYLHNSTKITRVRR